MKSSIIFLIVSLIGFDVYSQNTKDINTEIKKVMVYQKGAEITREAKVILPKGKTILLLQGLTSKLDPQSIQAKGNQNLMIVSVSHKLDYLNKLESSDQIKALEKEKKLIIDSLSLTKAFVEVYQKEKEMILANKEIGGDHGVKVEELKNTAVFFRSRLIEIETQKKKLENKMYQLKRKSIEISQQLLELNAKSDQPTSEVKLVVVARKADNYSIDVKYLVQDAGWVPNYDIRISDVNEPMRLVYKAKVFQNTDEDWKDVKLGLSSGNPAVSNYKPELSAYYLTFNNFYKPFSKRTKSYNIPFSGRVQGQVTDKETGEAIPGANIIVKGTTIGTISDMDGKYQIDLPSDKRELEFSFIGYKTEERFVNGGIVNVAFSPESLSLDEVVVTAYGVSASNALQGRVAGVTIANKKEQIPLGIEKRQVSTEFEIKIPYSIPSDHQNYDVEMLEYEVPVDYHFSAIPKLSEDTYLTAAITDWSKYQLLSGQANLFFKGIYQGQSFLDLNSLEDTLRISIGRDKDVMVKREIQTDFSKRSSIGNYIKQIKSWKITIKNNKDIPVRLDLEDQYPIAKNSEIKVELLENSGAKVNQDMGKLMWNLNLDAQEKKTLIIKYEVKYPKERKLIVE